MHPAVHRIAPVFPDFESLRNVLSSIEPGEWRPSLPDGPFKDNGWRVILLVGNGKRTEFVSRFPELGRALDFFKDPIASAVLYSMLPGADVHMHRDLSGTFELGLVKYHVPIQTNPFAILRVDDDEYNMPAGELWALNTSYRHGIRNEGVSERIHLVVQVERGEWSRKLLPPHDLRYYCHFVSFMGVIAWHAVRNLLTDRHAISRYSGMSRGLVRRLLHRQAA